MHTARRIAAAALAATLTIPALTLAAQATPPAHAASASKAEHGHKYGHKHGHRGPNASQTSKADNSVTKVRNIARALDLILRNAGSDERLRGLSETSVNAVRANLTADHNDLVALVKAVAADPTQASTAYTTLRGYRTANYAIAVGQIRLAERVSTYAAAYTDNGATLTPEQQATYDEALGHLNTALTSARLVRATSNPTALTTIGSELRTAIHQFADLRSSLDNAADDAATDDADTDEVNDWDDWGHDHHGWSRHRR